MDASADSMLIVTFDVTDPRLDIKKVKDLIRTDETILNWWNHIPGVFLIVTRLSANELTDLILPAADGANFLVAGVDPTRSQGWLPESAWRWIKRREEVWRAA